jgi:hypothetical protein
MPACPVKSSPEWIKLVSSLGERDAYKVFLANNEEVPDMDIIDSIASEMEQINNFALDTERAVEETSLEEIPPITLPPVTHPNIILTDGIRTEPSILDPSKPIILLQSPNSKDQIVLDGNQRIRQGIAQSSIVLDSWEDVQNNLEFLQSLSEENNVIRTLLSETESSWGKFKEDIADTILLRRPLSHYR